jgi:Right handed beta helix region
MSKTAVAILIGAALLFSIPAFAVDGVVLINQSTVIAAGGFPYRITQSGSYRLSGNLTVPNVNTDGVDITASNVTLDLNGFTISGPVTCTLGTYPVQCSATGSGIGIKSSNNNITVRNGTVQGMGRSGMDLEGAGGILVEDMHVDSNAGSSDAGIRNAGIVVGNVGIVTHCTVTTNAGHGIVAVGSASVTISLNNVTFNGGDGINGGGEVSNNTVFSNGQIGINSPAAAINNAVEGNIGWGIFHANGYGGNVAQGNTGGAITGGASMHNNICDGAVC